MMKIIRATGDGQGSCTSCDNKGIWNRSWMCFLYKIEGIDGLYCEKCLKEFFKKGVEKND